MIVTILVIKIPNNVNAQITEEWAARYNGPKNYLDGATDLTIGPSGNIYVTGKSYGNGTGTDYDTVAYDPEGNLLWSARYHGTGQWGDTAFAITTDSSENVYVTGTSHSATNHYDIVTISYDSFGNERWIARYDGPAQNDGDRAFVITTDSSGNVYVAGESGGTRTDNYVTIKYDSFGNEIWVARYNGSETSTSHRAWAIAVDSSGNVYVSGEGWYGTWGGAVVKYDPFGNEVWVRTYDVGGVYGGQGLAVELSGCVYVSAGSTTIKYVSEGNVIWSSEYTGLGDGWLIGTSLALDLVGNVYVSGYGKSLGANNDYLTVKYDQDGNELWWVSYNGPGNNIDRALDMVLDTLGNVYVAGRSTGSNGFDDCAAIAYDLNGNELWVARYNGPGNQRDGISSIAIDSIGNIYVTGKSDVGPSQSSYVTIKYSRKEPVLKTTININPDTLNLKSKGRWITAYITLNNPYDDNDIDISTLILEDTIHLEWGDIQDDTLMVKLDRSDVEDMLLPGTYNLKVTGELTDGTSFEGYSDEIRVIDPGK
jgi:hypothetical protein